MKYKVVTLLALCLVISVHFASAQLPKNKYLIFTFEYTNNRSPHGTQIYYWIQSVDSINQQKFPVSKLILSGYSVSELQDCCVGKPINPYTSTSNSTNLYNFNQKYYKALDTIEHIIKRHRKIVQVIHKGHGQELHETSRVYITPIEGVFCLSRFIPIRDKEMMYKGSITIPYTNFSFYPGFWASEENKYIIKRDYSNFSYSILPANKGK